MSNTLFEIKQLEKTFAANGVVNKVLKNISFSVHRGEFIAIQGPSGCGKSTLLSILGLLDNSTAGQYKLCDKDVNTLSVYQKSVLRNQQIGWIFQNFNLIGEMTAIENVSLPLRYHPSIKKAVYRSKAMQALDLVGMGDKADFYPNQLSGGQQQRIAIARALVTSPSLILADEPTGNLDSENAELVFKLLQKIHGQNATIIMVTHADELALRCQRQIKLRDGQIISESMDNLVGA